MLLHPALACGGDVCRLSFLYTDVDLLAPCVSQAIARACDFLLGVQRPDGGWAESYLSCQDKVHPCNRTAQAPADVLAILQSGTAVARVAEWHLYSVCIHVSMSKPALHNKMVQTIVGRLVHASTACHQPDANTTHQAQDVSVPTERQCAAPACHCRYTPSWRGTPATWSTPHGRCSPLCAAAAAITR
jgi:Prenyltransferase and squalene oxidase repeat